MNDLAKYLNKLVKFFTLNECVSIKYLSIHSKLIIIKSSIAYIYKNIHKNKRLNHVDFEANLREIYQLDDRDIHQIQKKIKQARLSERYDILFIRESIAYLLKSFNLYTLDIQKYIDMIINENEILLNIDHDEGMLKIILKLPLRLFDCLSPITNYPMDIDKIKKIPIVEYLQNTGIYPVSKSDKIYTYRSLKHNDKNPSLQVYINKNDWFDFSEQRGGSIIDLVMYMDNCPFDKAIKKLTSYKKLL